MVSKANNKNKNKELRSIKYWLTKNSVRTYCWIVQTQIDDMISHPGKLCYNILGEQINPTDITISKATLKYIYSVYLTGKSLVALVEAIDGSIYLIKNKNRLAKAKNLENIENNTQTENNIQTEDNTGKKANTEIEDDNRRKKG